MTVLTLSPNGLDQYLTAEPPQRLLVGTVDGVVDLRCSGGSWSEVERSLPGAHVSSLVALPQGEIVYAGSHGHGVYRRPGADAWVGASAGLTSENVYSLTCRRGDRGTTVYAGTEPAMLFTRVEGDETWDELEAVRAVPGRETWDFPAPPNIAHAKHVDFDPRDAQTFYVSIEQGALLKTFDGGRTFRQLAFKDDSYVYNSDAHRLAVNPLNPNEIYLSGGDGIARSSDAGETWEHVTTPAMRIGYPDATFCSPLEDGVIYTAGAGGRPGIWRKTGNADAAMARSRDRGKTWETLTLRDLRGNIEAATMAGWPGGYGFFVATTDGEIFASVDRGETWSLIVSGLPAISKGVHAHNVMVGRGAA